MTEPVSLTDGEVYLIAAEQVHLHTWDFGEPSGLLAAIEQIIAARVAKASLPDPKGGCVCTAHSESRGGVYSEIVWEYEPACPEHSEHLYDPKIGVWVLRSEPVSRTGGES